MSLSTAHSLLLGLMVTFALVLQPHPTVAAHQHGITTADRDRNHYVSLEATLWSLIERRDTRDALAAIFEMHHNFTVAHLPLAVPGSGHSDAFIALDAIYEWKHLEQHLHGITNLFEVVRLTLDDWATASRPDEFNELALTDLAETIQEDGASSFRVAKTMDDIENIMVKQSLYYRAMLVKIRWGE